MAVSVLKSRQVGKSLARVGARVGGDGIDKYIVWLVMGLCAFGVVAVYSAISFLAETKSSGNTESFLFRHVVRVALSLGAMGVFSVVSYRVVARFSRILLVGSIGLLIAVQLVGVSSGGAARWLQLGSVGFQPSDIAKVALLIHVAVLLTRKQEYIKRLRRAFVPLFLWILGTVAMIGMEDLSSAALVLAAAVTVCFVGRVSVIHLGGLGLMSVILAFLLLLASPNRAARVESYLGLKIFPHTSSEQVFDAQDEGYQKQQARIAIALGGVTGVGPGKSTQRDFLPAPYNDFIFAIIAEEYGLLGALTLLSVFAALLFRGLLRIGRRAPDPLGLFIAVGLTTLLALYGFVHAGVAVGLLPVTGLPLPFVSYGGTSMVANGVMIGILLNVGRTANREA